MAVADAAKSASAGRPVILIGFAEAMAAIETAWSLADAGFRVTAFSRAGSKPALRRVRGVRLHEIPPPEQNASAAAAAVQKLCDVVRPAAVLPLDDHAVWACAQLGSSTVPVAGATGTAAGYAIDKALQTEAAMHAGLAVPPTEVLDDLTDFKPTRFPIMVKPARALYELNGAITRPTGIVCADEDELARAAARTWPGPLLVQPLIRGVGEGLFGHVGPRGVVGWSAHRRVRMVNPQGSASSACRSVAVDQQLIEPGPGPG